MPRFSLLLAVALFIFAGCAAPSRPISPQSSPDAYHLVWSDEFNTDGPLNPKDWNYEQGFVRNLELQWYQPQNAICHNGLLIIEARREHKPNPHYNPSLSYWTVSRPSIDYTSTSVTTAGKHTFQYGRFEIRARINTLPGSWPAFWTLGAAGPWPACGEVDIMEYYQHNLLANIAWAGPNHAPNGSTWNTVRTPLSQLGPDWSNQFHTWRMDWDPSSIKLYCDNILLNSQDLSQTINRPDQSPSNPFHQPVYFILNQAIGGQAGGDPSQTPFPVRYEIDYIRIYQKPSQSAANTHLLDHPSLSK